MKLLRLQFATSNNQHQSKMAKRKFEYLKSQIVASNYGGKRKLTYAFTEQGAVMLSSVLNRDAAIAMNIKIIRLFTKMRELMIALKDIMLQ